MDMMSINFQQSSWLRLASMVNGGRMPHALLISGPEGSGELMLGRKLAQYIHCTGRAATDLEPCGKCDSCRQHLSLQHADLHYVFPVVKRKIGQAVVSDDWLAEWREQLRKDPWMEFTGWQSRLGDVNAQPRIYVADAELLRRKMNLSSAVSAVNIALIWLPERMEEAMANKILKLIEEPESGTMFILVSNSPGDILPTIYSRCQRVELRRFGDEELASLLAGGAEPDAGHLAAAHLAEGNYIVGRSVLAHGAESSKHLELFMQLMRLAYGRKVTALKKWSEAVNDLGRDAACRFLQYSQRMVRENFIYNLGDARLNYMTTPEEQFSSRFAPFINERNVEELIAELNEAERDIRGNANAKIVLFDFAIKVIIMLRK